ncbi:MAG TPA: hypothetical protein VF334_13625, partial [Polyangia bacterium]
MRCGLVVVALVALASGCDTGPLFPDMTVADMALPPAAGDLGSDPGAPVPADAALPGRMLVWSDE